MKTSARVVAGGLAVVGLGIAVAMIWSGALGGSSQERPPAVLSVLDADDLRRNGITLVQERRAIPAVTAQDVSSTASRNNGDARIGETRLVRLTVSNTRPTIDGRLVWAIEIDEPAKFPGPATHGDEARAAESLETFWVEFYDAESGEFVFAYSGGID